MFFENVKPRHANALGYFSWGCLEQVFYGVLAIEYEY